MILVKSCSPMENDTTLDSMEDYEEHMNGKPYFHKLINTETHEYLKDHEVTIEKNFLRRKSKSGEVFTIPLVKIFIDGNPTSLNKIFKKFWS